MFAMIALIPILILIVIIYTLYHVLSRPSKKVMSITRVYVIFGSYVSLLLISLIVFLIAPYPKDAIVSEKVENDMSMDMYSVYYDILEEGDSIENYSQYKEEIVKFDFEGDQLWFKSLNSNALEIPIIIEEKNEVDGIVEVEIYSTLSSVDGIDLSDHIKPLNVMLKNNDTLQIGQPHSEISLISPKKEFIFNQFSKTKGEDEGYYPQTYLGESLLYIRVPKEVTIEAYDDREFDVIKK